MGRPLEEKTDGPVGRCTNKYLPLPRCLAPNPQSRGPGFGPCKGPTTGTHLPIQRERVNPKTKGLPRQTGTPVTLVLHPVTPVPLDPRNLPSHPNPGSCSDRREPYLHEAYSGVWCRTFLRRLWARKIGRLPLCPRSPFSPKSLLSDFAGDSPGGTLTRSKCLGPYITQQ